MKLPTGKQVLGTIVVVFIAYAIFTSPNESADTTQSLWGHIKDGVDSISTFFDGVLK